MNEKNDDLTDALQGLDGETPGEAPSAEELASEVGEDGEEGEAAAPKAGTVELAHTPEMPVPAAYRKAPLRSSSPVSVKGRKRLINTIFVLGALMLIPGVWAAAVLMGLGVPGSHKDNASGMAKMMLICWPLALLLFMFAGWLAMDLKRMQAAARRVRQ